jgi:hypothetical protein
MGREAAQRETRSRRASHLGGRRRASGKLQRGRPLADGKPKASGYGRFGRALRCAARSTPWRSARCGDGRSSLRPDGEGRSAPRWQVALERAGARATGSEGWTPPNAKARRGSGRQGCRARHESGTPLRSSKPQERHAGRPATVRCGASRRGRERRRGRIEVGRQSPRRRSVHQRGGNGAGLAGSGRIGPRTLKGSRTSRREQRARRRLHRRRGEAAGRDRPPRRER